MEYFMKKILFLIFILIMSCAELHAYSAHHYYLPEQIVESVQSTRITVSGRLYAVKPEVPVVAFDKTRKMRLDQVRPGDKVTIRVEGSEVTEIRVEGR
jgi:hypothetical protein